MSDIFVMIRNQNNVAMTSVDGIAFITLLTRDGRVAASTLARLEVEEARKFQEESASEDLVSESTES